jgi:hypothetical protein
MRLSECSDIRLLDRLDALVASHRQCMADIVAHLAELDSRSAVIARGYPSLFQYCVEHLRFSEDEACRRIEAARLSHRFPAVLPTLASGKVTLSSLSLLKPHITLENSDELLAGIEGRSCRAAKEWLAARFPQPDMPERIRPLPKSKLEPLSEDRFAFQATISRSLKDEIELVRDLMRHRNPSGDLERILGEAIAALRAKLEKQKLGATTKPPSKTQPAPSKTQPAPSKTQPAPSKTQPATASRHIPSAIKRAIVKIDGLRCSFVGIDGKRCNCRAFLEFDHVYPRAIGGGNEASNVRILCRAHNQHAAERVYGTAMMRRWRSSATQRSAPPRVTGEPGAPRASVALLQGGW